MADDAARRLVTKTEYARHRGVSQAMVTHWKNAKRIQLTDDGRLVDLEASDAMLAASMDPNHGGRGGTPQNRQGPAQQQAPTNALTSEKVAGQQLANERARIELQVRSGQLCETERAVAAITDVCAQVKQTLEQWPHAVGPDLEGVDARTAINRLEGEVADLLRRMSDQVAQLPQYLTATKQ